MASLPLPMRRRLAVVDNDGDGATGDSIDDNCNSATNVNNDGDGTRMTTSTIMIMTDNGYEDNDCDDVTGNDNVLRTEYFGTYF